MAKRRRDEIEDIVKRTLLYEGAAETVTDAVRQALRRDILTAAFEPGVRLSVRTLGERYGVGATPVREALWSLVGEGLIVAEAQHGFRVAVADLDQLVNLLQLRRRVEPWLLTTSLRHGDAAWRREVERAFTAFQPIDAQVGDLRPLNEEWEYLHKAFHLALIAGAGMTIALVLAQRWYDEIDRYRRIRAGSLAIEAGAKPDHQAMFDLVMKGNETEAVALLIQHINDTAERHNVSFQAEDAPAKHLVSKFT